MNKAVLITLVIIFCGLCIFAQKKEKQSPVELMFDYYDDAFKPFDKKNWFVGLSFNVLDTKYQNNANILGLDQIITSSNFNYDVHIKGGYFIGKYSMLGLGISHGRDKAEGNGILLFDTISSESVTNRNMFTPFIRSYYPLSKNHRINFFNEMNLEFGFTNTELTKDENNSEVEKVNTESFIFGVGFSPGITFYAIESFAFEVQLDILGYRFEKSISKDQDGNETSYQTHNVNFTLNLLSLNFGLAYYFGAKN